MSIRAKILAALKKNGAQTYDDLELSTQIERSQLRIAVNDAKKAGHVAMGRDDVTHQPAYKITPEGIKWLKANSGQKRNSEKQAHEQPKPGVGVNNPGSRESVPPVGQGRPPAEVAADQGNAGAGHDAPADSGEFNWIPVVKTLESELDKRNTEIIHLQFIVEATRKALDLCEGDGTGIVPAIQALIESNTDWRKSSDRWMELAEENASRANRWHSEFEKWSYQATSVGVFTPHELAALIKAKDLRLGDLETQVAFLLDELKAHADIAQKPESTAAAPIGFVVHAPKRKPRLCLKYARALETAQTAARVAGSAKVLALVPVGTARRKKDVIVEWTPVQQEAGHE